MCGLIHELNSAELNQIESNLNEIESIEANLDRERHRRRDGGSQVATEKKTKIQRNKVKKKNKGKRERREPILMCESAAQLETGLIMTLGLLSSPTHSIASL